MAKQIKELVSTTAKDLLEIEKQLLSAKETRDELNRQLKNARRRLDTKYNGTGYPNRLVDKIIKDLKSGNELVFQVVRHIDNAAEGGEFDKPVYKSALYSVAQDKDIYNFIRSGAGWGIKIRVLISFEESAGRLVDWAKGIKDYREKVLKSKVEDEGSDRGLKATNWWLSHVYGSSLETKTVLGRLGYSGRPAPFWQILDAGSVSLPSDRPDGSYNPVPQGPTGFIEKAEHSCETLFLAEFLPEEQKWFEEAKLFSEEVKELQNMRDSYSKEVKELKVESKLNRMVYDSFGKKKRYVDDKKLEIAIKKYRAGEEFEKGTIELTKAGSPSRVRTSTQSFIKRVEGYDF